VWNGHGTVRLIAVSGSNVSGGTQLASYALAGAGLALAAAGLVLGEAPAGIEQDVYIWSGVGVLWASILLDARADPRSNAVKTLSVVAGGALLGVGQTLDGYAVSLVGLVLFTGPLLYDAVSDDVSGA
jgi:hypothetical protein